MTDLSGAQGTQVGDSNLQVNLFTGAGRERLRRYGTPPRLADSFQPRPAVRAEVTAGLASGGAVLSQVVAAGNGGVGKTQLAAAVFHESRADFAAWITATARSPIVSGYAGAAAEIEPAWAHLPPDQAAERFLAWLSGAKASWLVVLDDVADPDDLRGLWPQGPAGAVLVTTRRRDLRVGTRVDVDVFTPGESLAYLTERLATDGQRSDVLDGADRLAEHLGHLPVALSQAAAVVDFDGITCADYGDQHDLSSLRPIDDYSQPVGLTWQAAVERADAMAPVGLASRALELAAILDPNGIPQEVWTGQGDDMRRALRNLHALHLVTHDPTGGPTSVRIHALVQEAALHTLDDVTDVVRHAADRLVAIWPDPENDPALSQSLRSNAAALARHPGLWSAAAHGILIRSGNSLGVAGQVHAAVAFFADLIRSSTELLGPDHPDTLDARHHHAYWRGEAGDPAGAISALEGLVADRVRLLGAAHPDTLTSRQNLARRRGEAGNPVAAAAALKALLADRLRVSGVDHLDTLATRHHLAYWRGDAGDPAGATAALEELLVDQHRVLGAEHPDTLVTRGNVARWRGRAGNPHGAVADFEQLLVDRRRILGDDHPNTLTTRHNLAYWRGRAGDPHGAVRELERLLPDRLRVLGPDHPATLETRHQIARWRGETGDHGAAVTGLEAVLADRTRALGADHPETLTSRHEAACWRGCAGDPEAAVSDLEELLADRTRVLGTDHPKTLATRFELARWRGEAGDPSAAVTGLTSLLDDRRRVLGEQHPDTIATELALGYWKVRRG